MLAPVDVTSEAENKNVNDAREDPHRDNDSSHENKAVDFDFLRFRASLLGEAHHLEPENGEDTGHQVEQ